MVTRELKTFEGQLVNKYPPSEAGDSKKLDFYIQPVDGERIKIGVWESDQIAYSVAQAMTEGDNLVVKATENPNKRDPGKFFLNAKDIIVTGSARTSGEATTQPQGQVTTKTHSSGYVPSAGELYRADGAETGNSKSNATLLIIQHMKDHEGELPNREWMLDAALAVNIQAALIRSNTVGVEDVAAEEIIEEL